MAPRSQHATLARRLTSLGAAVALVFAVGQSSVPAQPEHVHAAPAEQATATPTPPGSYLRTFDEYENDTPLDVPPSSILDVTVHSRDNNTWPATGGLEPMAAEHGAMCEAPPAVHALTGSYDDAVFVCKDHIMTAIKAGGYGAIYLTPNQMADFSTGEAVVKFDLSTFRDASRDWMDLWISPFSEQVAVPYESSTPDLLGPPKHAIHVKMEGSTHGTPTGPVSGTPFGVYVVNNFTTTRLDTNSGLFYEQFLTPSMATRTTFELHLSRTHIKFGMPQYNAWWIDSAISDLGWDRGVVQFGHHSYNPEKECQEGPDPYLHPGDPGCRGGTWHWDNLSISPSVPYTLIPATARVADATNPTYTFPAAAPADSYLLVHGTAETAELSLDGGTTWASFPVQQHDTSLEGPAWGHARSFWTAVPAGTTSVQVRGHPSTGAPLGPFVHASIVSLNARPLPPTPTPLPATNTPAPPTNTPAPPTSTPTATALTAIRINVGTAGAYTDGASHVWSTDTDVSGGNPADMGQVPIAGTSDDLLYNSFRYGSDMAYAIPVPNGTYTVTVKMVEHWMSGPGQRVFDVMAEGTTALDDVDIYAAVGTDTAYDRTFTATVSDGTLNLTFSSTADLPIISAIQVVPAISATPTSVPPTNTPIPPTSTPTPLPTATPTPADQCRTHVRDRRSWSEVLHDWLPWVPEYASAACP